MKKFLILLILIIFTVMPVYSAGKNKQTDKNSVNTEEVSSFSEENNETSDKNKTSANEKESQDGSTEMTTKKFNKNEDSFDRGYNGKIPDISEHFKIYQDEDVEPAFEINEDFNDPYKVKPAPRDNPAFINIILKEDKTSQYINELNEMITLIEKIQKTVEENASLQVFSARAFNFDKYVEFFRNKYQNRPESSYQSYKKLMQLNNEIQALAALRREKEVYSPYITSASNGNAFSDNNIEQQNEYLLENIRSTLTILKEAK
ncbi:hypothetical protein IJ732_03320 [bacterium]|nr:hypothetical protein [bacterium]